MQASGVRPGPGPDERELVLPAPVIRRERVEDLDGAVALERRPPSLVTSQCEEPVRPVFAELRHTLEVEPAPRADADRAIWRSDASELTERVMEDWFALLNLGKRMAATGSSDSHRIQYQWAGYPRTFALLDGRSAGDTGQPIDTKEVVASLKKGKSFVSSGPIIELELSEA